MANAFCPECGNRVHKSHTRGFGERLVKVFTLYKTYRCHDCGWRGWLLKGKTPTQRSSLKTILSLVITLLITVLIIFYIIERSNPDTPSKFNYPPSFISLRSTAR